MLFSAAAQAAAPIVVPPGSARPELVDRDYRDIDRPSVSGAPIVNTPDEQATGIESDISFELKNITFEGLTRFTEEDLKPIYRDKLGTRITLGELNGIVNNITAFYRNKGYILTRAVLTPQRIEGGVVAVRIVEGFIGAVRIEGDAGKSGLIQRYADKIKNSKPLNAETLERYLLLMEDLPGVQARALLTPSPDTPGAADIIITITRKTVEASATLDNRGSRFLGPIQAGLTSAVNNLFGFEEQTQVRVLNSALEPDELQFFELRHAEPIGDEGTTLILSGNFSHTRPGHTLEILSLNGKSSAVSAGLTHPIQRSRRSNWLVNTDFTSRHANVEVLNITNLYEDTLRVWTLGTSYDFIDSSSAVNQIAASASKGFKWDTGNGGRFHSRGNGQPDFLKFNATATRLQPVSGPWDFFGAVTGQYAANALYAAEEFALGGQTFGSAYDSAELTGDAGLATRLELRYSRRAEFVQAYQAYGFYDLGRVWNRSIIPGTEMRHNSLASTGLGARFNITDAVSGGAEVALPLTRPVSANGADGAAPRAFFNLQVRY